MGAAAILVATLKFAAWELAVFSASLRIARAMGWGKDRPVAEMWLAVVAIQVTLESSFAALFSFAGWNSAAAYWTVGALCALAGARERLGLRAVPSRAMVALAAPLVVLACRPVEEIDSINYLHYLIDWMANRATPYTFATNYVAFWELSFLPSWMLTGVDLFFPLLAMKAIALLALGLWLVGRELGLPDRALLWTVAGSLTMRHYWYEYSGVPTLKNDVLHGVGFVLLTLAVLRSARRKLQPGDAALLAFGVAFACVKYTGIFLAGLAIAVLLIRDRKRLLLPVAGIFLVTSGHYYLRSTVLHGSPFYPFQINIGPIHLPGTADLSYSSILYNLHDPRLWRALFWPAGGVSPAGILFPAILAATLIVSAAIVVRAAIRRRFGPLDITGAALLCGWLLYFRSVFSACASPGDLSFILNGLNSIRYVDGVLAVSELFLVTVLGPRLAIPLVAVNMASRLFLLYGKLQPQVVLITIVVGLSIAAALRWRALRERSAYVLLLLLVGAVPFLVERNRAGWTTYWNDLKPALAEVRSRGLAVLTLEDGGYYAGHVVAAGNPVDPAVSALRVEDVHASPAAQRPPFLAVLAS